MYNNLVDFFWTFLFSLVPAWPKRRSNIPFPREMQFWVQHSQSGLNEEDYLMNVEEILQLCPSFNFF